MRWTLAGPGGSSSAGESRGRQLWRICDSRYPHLGTGFPPYSTRRAYSRISFLQCLELRAHLPCVRSYGGSPRGERVARREFGVRIPRGNRGVEEAIRNGTTPQVHEELFRHLGPTACIFAAPDVKKGAGESAAADLLIGTDDAAALGKALDALAAQFNAYFQGEKGADGQRTAKGADNAQPGCALERLPAPDRGYKLISPAGLISWITADVQPTILIGKSYVAVANNPILARAAWPRSRGPGTVGCRMASWRRCSMAYRPNCSFSALAIRATRSGRRRSLGYPTGSPLSWACSRAMLLVRRHLRRRKPVR